MTRPSAPQLVRLDDWSIERVAEALEARLRRAGLASEYVTAAEVAADYRVSRDWVYAHAGELGAERLGGGGKPRVRFRRNRLEAYFAAASDGGLAPSATPAAPAHRRAPGSEPRSVRRGASTPVDHLPASR